MEHLYRRVSAYGTKARARSVRDLSSDAFRERTRLAMREIASQLLDPVTTTGPALHLFRASPATMAVEAAMLVGVFGGANLVLARVFGEASCTIASGT